MTYKDLIKDRIACYMSYGWVAFWHPRLHTISLNGGREESEWVAMEKMKVAIDTALVSSLWKGIK